jgi:hypothetical protein
MNTTSLPSVEELVTGPKRSQRRSDWMRVYKEKRRRWAPKTRRWDEMNREAAYMEILDDMFWGGLIYRRNRWNGDGGSSRKKAILLDNKSQYRDNPNETLEY